MKTVKYPTKGLVFDLYVRDMRLEEFDDQPIGPGENVWMIEDGKFPKMDLPYPIYFMENPIKMDENWGYHHGLEGKGLACAHGFVLLVPG